MAEEYTQFCIAWIIFLLVVVGFGGWGRGAKQKGVKVNHTPYSRRLPGNLVLDVEFGVSFLLFNAYLSLALSTTVSFQLFQCFSTATEQNTCTLATSANSESALKWSGS